MGNGWYLRSGPNTRRAALARGFMSHGNVRSAALAPEAERIDRRHIEFLCRAGFGERNHFSCACYLGQLATAHTCFPLIHSELGRLGVESISSVFAQMNDCFLISNRDRGRPVLLSIPAPARPDDRGSGDELDSSVGEIV